MRMRCERHRRSLGAFTTGGRRLGVGLASLRTSQPPGMSTAAWLPQRPAPNPTTRPTPNEAVQPPWPTPHSRLTAHSHTLSVESLLPLTNRRLSADQATCQNKRVDGWVAGWGGEKVLQSRRSV